jgi:NADH:ubiquinone oxidoreductase subunit E
MSAVKDKTAELKEFIARCRDRERFDSYLISVLHKAQELNGYLDEKSMDVIAYEMKIPTARIYGVATFYHYFNLKPVGKNIISVCMGTACYVKGADRILDKIRAELNLEVGGTTPDSLFTLQEARCLGACGQAPVLMLNNKIHGKMTPKKILDIIRKLKRDAVKESV